MYTKSVPDRFWFAGVISEIIIIIIIIIISVIIVVVLLCRRCLATDAVTMTTSS